ncbi:MAG: 4-hydroxy-3-methylbut-2-enyl diphosphate reductase [Candidatus Omnitrophota bacterium]
MKKRAKRSGKKRRVKIVVSAYSGFCFGVRRALNMAKKALKGRSEIYSLGPIIHNPQVVEKFSKKGLKIVKGADEIPLSSGSKAVLLIPSHGISPDVLRNKSVTFIDTTCPLVGRVQRIVKDLKEKGYFIIIVGDKRHPEVRGLVGIAGKMSRVLKNKEEAVRVNLRSKKIALISQTTATTKNFKEILYEIAKKDFVELISFNTVCKNTIDRQKEARRIAKKVESMVVIGGRNSANTTRLAEVCRRINPRTYHVESKSDLNSAIFSNASSIGIATGASTPPAAIEEIIKELEKRNE